MPREPICKGCGCTLAAMEYGRGYCVACQATEDAAKHPNPQDPPEANGFPMYCSYCAAEGVTVLVGYGDTPNSHGVCKMHREKVDAGEYSVPEGHEQVLYEEEEASV